MRNARADTYRSAARAGDVAGVGAGDGHVHCVTSVRFHLNGVDSAATDDRGEDRPAIHDHNVTRGAARNVLDTRETGHIAGVQISGAISCKGEHVGTVYWAIESVIATLTVNFCHR